MSRPLGVIPFPLAEVGRASGQEFICQGDIVIQIFSVSEVRAADRVAAAQRLGFLTHQLTLLYGHAPVGLGVFDATILLGLGGEDKDPLIAGLLMFRVLYHLVPFVLALALFGAVEGWRGLRAKRGRTTVV